MSRTRKGGKAPGYEYWTRRPFNGHGACPGSYTKKRTHKAERRIAKKESKTHERTRDSEPPSSAEGTDAV